MLNKAPYSYCCLLIIAVISCSCNAPRSMLNSGKVVPKDQVRFGRNTTINISSAPIERSIKGAYDLGKSISDNDTILYSDQITHLNSAFMAYCLDPIGYNTETFLRIGMGHRMDFGYRNTGGANAVDVMYQFLGSNKTFNESEKGGFYGSIGVQYSWENYRFINYKVFDKLQNVMGMKMSRRDFTIPLVFSKSFGPEERVGCFSFGLVYSHSFIKYSVTTKNIYAINENTNIPTELLAPINGKSGFDAYGTFLNLKIGKKYVFFNVSLAAYYQNYGRYTMLGGSSVSLKGISIVPSYGVQFSFLFLVKY